MKKGDRVRLKGKTLKGKNRVREMGRWWSVREVAYRSPQFAPSDAGPWALVVPLDHLGKEVRWIKVSGDADFEIFPA